MTDDRKSLTAFCCADEADRDGSEEQRGMFFSDQWQTIQYERLRTRLYEDDDHYSQQQL